MHNRTEYFSVALVKLMAAVQVGSTKHELAAAGYSGDPLKLANSVHSLTVEEGLKALGKRNENEK